MSRRPPHRFYRKANPYYSPLDLVVCEGETEVDYLCELARSWRIHVHIIKGIGTDPKSIVNTAKTKTKEIHYDKVFCVFDRDNQPGSFANAIDLCYHKGFIPIISNPCFEVWPLLHFHLRESGLGTPQQVLKELKKLAHFADYQKDGVRIFNNTHHHIDTACKNASTLASKQFDDPKKDPFTNMHLLIARFKELKNEQNYFGKNRNI